jgi:hypothetical protein
LIFIDPFLLAELRYHVNGILSQSRVLRQFLDFLILIQCNRKRSALRPANPMTTRCFGVFPKAIACRKLFAHPEQL